MTTPCGHTFCQTCLARLFDHSPYCPVCRSPLGEVSPQSYHINGGVIILCKGIPDTHTHMHRCMCVCIQPTSVNSALVNRYIKWASIGRVGRERCQLLLCIKIFIRFIAEVLLTVVLPTVSSNYARTFHTVFMLCSLCVIDIFTLHPFLWQDGK